MMSEGFAAAVAYALVDAGVVRGDDLDRAIAVILDTAAARRRVEELEAGGRRGSPPGRGGRNGGPAAGGGPAGARPAAAG